jgi:hypothetical protein
VPRGLRLHSRKTKLWRSNDFNRKEIRCIERSNPSTTTTTTKRNGKSLELITKTRETGRQGKELIPAPERKCFVPYLIHIADVYNAPILELYHIHPVALFYTNIESR